jgi:hypothetical protein
MNIIITHPERNPAQFEKSDPERLGRLEAGFETPSQVGRLYARWNLNREGQFGDRGGGFLLI